jgi:hypothetical protein
MSKKKLLFVLSAICFAVAIIETVGAFWYWAIVGMSDQVGQAHFATVIVFGFLGFCLAMASDLASDT